MDNTKPETSSTNDIENELSPELQELADMADKMDENNPESEYNEAGFNSEGIHRNGTQYDDEGYGADGFDEDGVDREGFDREGFGTDERDREGFDRQGYNKNGYDRRGFNMVGIHKDTGTKYDGRTIFRDHKGYDRDGFDEYGFDQDGYDKDGFYRDGFNRDDINKMTGTKFDPSGWNRSSTIHKDTGNEYDPEGYNRMGYDKDGYNRDDYDARGYNRDGYNRAGFYKNGIHKDTGTKYDPDGYNVHGLDEDKFDKEGLYHDGKGHRIKYHNGYDVDGYDRDGYDCAGYDREGYDNEGYDCEGLDKDGYTREYNAKFNKYGIDENGYMKNGEMDPDIELAIAFAESGIKDLSKFAAEEGANEKEVRNRIKLARKKYPNIDGLIKDLLLTGNRMRMAAISGDCEKYINGELDANEFWDKHPRLSISNILSDFINNIDDKKRFSDRMIEGLTLDSENIEKNLRIFGASQYDVSNALNGVEEFKKIYTKFGTDGSPEQLQKKRENTKKIFDTIKYLGRYKNRNIDSLIGSRESNDGGQTWVEFTGENIGRAMDELKKAKRYICVKTVKDYIINQHK